MRQVKVLAALVALLAGCQSQYGKFDPLSTYGPSRIAPPGTGSARRPDPYYRGTLSSNTSGQAVENNRISRFTSEDNSIRTADQRGAASMAPNSDRRLQRPGADALDQSSRDVDESQPLDWRTPPQQYAGQESLPDTVRPRPRFRSSAGSQQYATQPAGYQELVQ